MAIEWIKSLHCKSKALDDVVHRHRHRHRRRHSVSSSTSSSCKSRVQGLKDIVLETTTRRSNPGAPQTPMFAKSLCLPEGHPSRNVVEIIFRSGWGEKDFPGRVEMVFKVQNLTRTVARFEEYREDVKSRARAGGDGEDHARCVVDGNEVMRFYCLGATTSGGAYETSGVWGLQTGKGPGAAAVCTYAGSGEAHEKAGGGRGRRVAVVCRVIAGRVWKEVGCDSVSTEAGELYVFDTRAVLPCFLIIYNIL